MGKRVFVVWIFVFCMSVLYGCSMVPNDEEIINGSVLENEIFWNNLDDEWMNDEELKINNEDWEEQDVAEDWEILEDDEEFGNEVDFEVVE